MAANVATLVVVTENLRKVENLKNPVEVISVVDLDRNLPSGR